MVTTVRSLGKEALVREAVSGLAGQEAAGSIAREGTRRVLGAAARAGVKRAVLTSSGGTAGAGDLGTPATETTYAEPSGTQRADPDSKILVEREAWEPAGAAGLELSVILPTFIQGFPLAATPHRTDDHRHRHRALIRHTASLSPACRRRGARPSATVDQVPCPRPEGVAW
ncbi:NAD-dependent epimerase/dehydratase family protein [Streptomyces sp. NPDC002343]